MKIREIFMEGNEQSGAALCCRCHMRPRQQNSGYCASCRTLYEAKRYERQKWSDEYIRDTPNRKKRSKAFLKWCEENDIAKLIKKYQIKRRYNSPEIVGADFDVEEEE